MTANAFGLSARVHRSRIRAMLAALGFAVLLASPRAGEAAAPAPAAKLQSSDQAFMDTPFALDYCNWRIKTITWMPDSAPLMQKLNIGSNTGLGSLVLTVALKNNGNVEHEVPEPRITAIFKDGSSSDNSSGSTAYSPSGNVTHGTYAPGSGGTITYVVPNVQQPTHDNPITKLVFYQSFTGLKPELIRLLAPPVTVMLAPSPEPT